MRSLIIGAVAAVIVGGITVVPLHAQSRVIAVTFDDLPAAGAADLAAARAMTMQLLRTLTSERVPATGFVNEIGLFARGETEGWTTLLESWLDAGCDLGNHTYSHVSIDQVPFEVYRSDLIRGEAVTRRLVEARGQRLRYFRHPQLRTGPTADDKAALDRVLAERGYRIAPVTIDNNDFIFANVYERARRKADRVTMDRVGGAYVPYMERVVSHFERLSREFLGYEVRHVLLLHANYLNADYLPDLLAMLRRRGYSFVTLDRALEDSAYALPDVPVARGLSWLHRWMLAKGLPLQSEPSEPAFVRQLYEQRQ